MTFKSDIEKDFGVTLTEKQEKQFELYYQMLVTYNEKVNLTSITEKTEVYYKHFYDSLTLLKVIKDHQSIADMGSGAGFPSIPLKIIYPNLKVVIIDALNKRILFLNELVSALGLEDVTLVHDRIEVYALKNQRVFDFVTARALGKLNLILELGIPMLKVKGLFIALKSQNALDELVESKQLLHKLMTKHLKDIDLELPLNYGYRKLMLFEKQQHVPNFPRKYQMIIKKPL